MNKWFWRVWTTAATITVLIFSIVIWGGRVEAKLDPMITNVQLQTDSIERVDNKLCYTWTSDKLKPTILANVDSYLKAPLRHEESWPEVKDRTTGLGWHMGGAHRIGPGDVHSQCIDLPVDPRTAKPMWSDKEPLIFNCTAWFKSDYGFWLVPLVIPEVTSP